MLPLLGSVTPKFFGVVDFVGGVLGFPMTVTRRVSVEMCRDLLQRPDLSDEEAEAILDQLYQFASVAADAFTELPRSKESIPIMAASALTQSTETLTSPVA